MHYRAIGSSYLIRQLAGSERLGGLRVTLSPRSDMQGSIQVQMTDWFGGGPHPNPIPEMGEIASRAILAFATEHAFDLSKYDIRLDQFLFHEVDSDPRCYAQAARSAFRAALESLNGEDNAFATG